MQALLDQITQTLEAEGAYAVIELLARQPMLLASQAYAKVQLELYWQRKDLQNLITLSQAGIQHGLVGAMHSTDPKEVEALKGSAKALSYNLGAFLWPGWEMEGFVLSPLDVATGYQAAKLNMRLALELSRPVKAQANARWLLGAQLLALARFDNAAEDFQRGAALAEQTSDEASVGMMRGFATLAQWFKTRNEIDAQALHEAVVSLRQLNTEDSNEYANQIVTARRVFERNTFI